MNINTLLLDRDGTLIEERHYLSNPDQVKLLPGAEQLAAWQKKGGRLFLVSNQSGIGRGYFTEQDLAACTARLQALLLEHGASLNGVRHCPHAPEENCPCRKPQTGMWESLQGEFCLHSMCCIMAGDKPEDLGLAIHANLAAAILVLTGHGQESAKKLGLALPPRAPWAEILPARLPANLLGMGGTTRIFLAAGLPQVVEIACSLREQATLPIIDKQAARP